jgi:hypothetical protein
MKPPNLLGIALSFLLGRDLQTAVYGRQRWIASW